MTMSHEDATEIDGDLQYMRDFLRTSYSIVEELNNVNTVQQIQHVYLMYFFLDERELELPRRAIKFAMIGSSAISYRSRNGEGCSSAGHNRCGNSDEGAYDIAQCSQKR